MKDSMKMLLLLLALLLANLMFWGCLAVGFAAILKCMKVL